MVSEKENQWIGVEYFCNETDDFWNTVNDLIIDSAIRELEKMEILQPGHVKDAVVVRVKKAYPSYYGSYQHFPVIGQGFLRC